MGKVLVTALITTFFSAIVAYNVSLMISKKPDPISIPNARAYWVNDRQFDIEAPEFYWNDTCPSIWVNWWVQTTWNGVAPITTHAIKGPFAKRGELPPIYKISITPQVGPPLHLRATIPDWLSRENVVLVIVQDTIPDSHPCESGWSGLMEVFRLQIEPAK
jgi:hypothetical protein